MTTTTIQSDNLIFSTAPFTVSIGGDTRRSQTSLTGTQIMFGSQKPMVIQAGDAPVYVGSDYPTVHGRAKSVKIPPGERRTARVIRKGDAYSFTLWEISPAPAEPGPKVASSAT
jgi:hypothetical protein